MTIGVGGSTIEQALQSLTKPKPVPAIDREQFQQRLSRLQEALRQAGGSAMYLHPGTNLYYFTGLRWSPSERMVAGVVPAEGPLHYISPRFEIDTLQDHWVLPGEIHTWEEHESPFALLDQVLSGFPGAAGDLYIDEVTPFLFSEQIRKSNPQRTLGEGRFLTVPIRSRKTSCELDLIRHAHQITLQVHRAAASILHPGITTTEVEQFIDQAHRQLGADDGSYFCIVLFGLATSFPHGVKDPQTLSEGDWVLVDTGCLIDGYNSDITRSYCFGDATEEQRFAWETEKAAQIAAFDAAQVGAPCEVCDHAARQVLEAAGYGPDYQLPGCPHRTGHGCGLDIHESPNLVRGEGEPLDVGMVFSSEPMLVLPGKFGVRLEDHFFVTEHGPEWFTLPAVSVDDPFGLSQ